MAAPLLVNLRSVHGRDTTELAGFAYGVVER
jgi:hypothetical protein